MTMLVVFLAGCVAGGVIVGTLIRLGQMDREAAAFAEGQRSIVPRRPVGDVPGSRTRGQHPGIGQERGASTTDHALVVAIVAGLVLVAPTLRWWIIPAALLAAALLAGAFLVEES